MKSAPHSPSRRAFLKTLTAGAAAMSTASLANETSRQTLRVGVLLPHSTLYPRVGESFLSGLRLALASAESAQAREALLAATSAGVTPSQAAKAIEEHLALQHADILVGMISNYAIASVKPLLERYRRPFIAATTGVNTHRPDEHDPLIATNSLEGWQATWEAGAWAAREYGPRAVVVTSRYDSGYDHVYTLAAGVEAGGGRVLRTVVTDDHTGGHDFYSAVAQVRQLRPDFVVMLHSHPRALATLEQIDSSLFADLPFVTTGVADPGVNEKVVVVAPWSAHLPTHESRGFVMRYARAHRAQPDVFALLGYETGGLLDQALIHAPNLSAFSRPQSLVETVQRMEFVSPRGELRAQPGSSSLSAARHLFRPTKGWGSVELATDLRPGHGTAAVQTLHAAPPSGWLHDYLCV